MRSSPAAIAIGLLQTAGGMVAVVLVWWTAGRRLDGWQAWVVDLAFWAYVVLRPASIPLTWLTTTWEITAHGVRVRRGVLARADTDVRWDEIVSFDVSQPYLHRLFGCYAIRFGLGTTQKTAVRLDAVSRTTRDRIAALARHAQLGPRRPASQNPVTVAPAPPRAEHEIYRICPRDYALISLTYGSFVLFVPAVLSLLDQVGEWVPLPLPDPKVVLSWPPYAQLAACLGVLALSVGYGWLFTWLRYRGFRVVRHGNAYLASGGLLSSETRSVTAAQVTGLKVTQNPVMRALGYGRVSVLTRDAGEQPMANLLFPLVRLEALPTALGPAMPVHSEVMAPTLRMSTPARATLAACLLLTWGVLLALAYLLRPDWIVATGTAVTVVVALVANACWVVASTVPGRSACYVRRGFLWISHVEFATSAIQVVESSQGPLGRLTGTSSVVLHYYDGRVRRVRALGCSTAQRRALTEPVLVDPLLADPLLV